MKKVKILLILIPLVLSTFLILLTIPAASAQEEWEGVGLEWYYDNLTDLDRKKIRQAIDYCIPRAQVLDGLMMGYGSSPASEITSNVMGHDSTIEARPYNTTKALELLTEVFGKTYDVNEDPSDEYTSVPYFKMVLIAPTTNVMRTQWASMINYALNNVGIESELRWWNWNVITPRIFTDPKQDPIGANYEHGGFDAYFIGWSSTPDPDYSGFYYSDSFAPAGDNSIYVSRPDLDDILNRSLQLPDLEDRLEALKDYQAWFHEWVPKFLIHQNENPYPQDPDWIGFDPFLYGRGLWAHNMSYIGDPGEFTDTYIITSPGDFGDFNPILSNSHYDGIIRTNVDLSLFSRRGSYNLTHSIPQLAESATASADSLTWTVKLREGVKFHDGSEVTADDVVFTYQAAADCPASTYAGDFETWFDPNATWIEKVDKYTVKLTLKEFYPYVESRVLTVPILSKAQMEPIALENWKTHGTNTGSIALLGCGPYVFDKYENFKEYATLYDGWDADLMGHDPNAVGGGIWLDTTNSPKHLMCYVSKEATSAIAELSTGVTDLLDYNVGVSSQIETLATADWCNLVTYLAYGWQEMSVNHFDPRWGLNPSDPREMYPEDYTKAPLEIVPILLALFGFAAFQLIRRRKK